MIEEFILQMIQQARDKTTIVVGFDAPVSAAEFHGEIKFFFDAIRNLYTLILLE